MAREVFKDGKWVEGKAEPEMLREDLRALPSEYITKDAADADKIHADDPQHIVDALKADLDKTHFGIDHSVPVFGEEGPETHREQTEAVKALSCAKPGEVVPINQWEVDCVRMRIIFALIQKAEQAARNGQDTNFAFAPQYLWFPENNVNIYERRYGNPPPKEKRPSYLKNIELWVDVLNWPKRMVDLLKEDGIEPVDIKTLLKEADRWYRSPILLV